jgi:D-3-phosphoglycerate dehydrogenase
MRILIADRLASFVSCDLEAAGCAVTVDAGLAGPSLAEALLKVDPDVLVVRSTKVTAEHLAVARRLSLVLRAGAGTNTIAVEAASARGIYVANCPGRNAIAVAELTFGHLINLDRRIVDNVVSLRAGRWEKKALGKARGLHGRTLALLGIGQIGEEVITRARAFGIHVRAWSRSLTPERAVALGVEFAATPLDACRGADMLSIHLAKTPETASMVGRELLEALRPGAYVVHTARGGIIDEAALLHVIETRGVRAGLDVFANEPSGGQGEFSDRAIAACDGVFGTHHIGASTDQATESVGREVVRIIDTYHREGEVENCVNLATQTAATHLLVVRHADRVGVLAGILQALKEDAVNVQEMENICFRGACAACAKIQVNRSPSAEALAKIEANPDILATSLVVLER